MFKGLILAGMCAINSMVIGSGSTVTGEIENIGQDISICCPGDNQITDCNHRTASNSEIELNNNTGTEASNQ